MTVKPCLVLATLAFAMSLTFPAVRGLAVEEGKPSTSALETDPTGWTDLLAGAGPTLKGWTRLPIPPTSTLKSQTVSQWSFDATSGELVCKGDGGHEWLRWDQEAGDAIFHVEWRFTPVPGKKGYNSGLFVRNSADGNVWLQAQTGDGSGGYLFGDTPVNGTLKRVNLSRTLKDNRVKPAGEWNTFEMTARGTTVALWVNGATTCVFDACETPKGYVGLEAEGWPITFRNVKLKPIVR